MKKKGKTMNETINDLLGLEDSQYTKEDELTLRRKIDAVSETSRIMGLDLLLIARSPGHGVAAVSIINNPLPNGVELSRETQEFAFIGTMLNLLVSGLLKKDSDYLLPVLRAIEECSSIDSRIELRKKEDDGE